MNSVDAYVAGVLRTGPVPDGTVLAPPQQPMPLRPRDVEHALSDPGALLNGVANPVSKVERLMRFARWLETAPPGEVPAELTSRAARYRFLVWSLPCRLTGDHSQPIRPERIAWPSKAGGTTTATPTDFVRASARLAQQDWLQFLAAAEDDPWLAGLQAAGDELLERDLRWLTRAWPDALDGEQAGSRWIMLDLAEPGAARPARRGQHRRVAADVAEVHWLPRGAVLPALAGFAPHRPAAALAALSAFPLAAVVLLGLVLTRHADWARAGSVWLLAAAAVTVAFVLPAHIDAVALLRVPAAAAAGQALLLSLTPRWWLAPDGWTIGLAMLLAVTAYIALEARRHGTGRWLAAWRAVLVAIIGALYAFVLSLAFLGFVIPGMGEDGGCLNGWWIANPMERLPLSRDCQLDLGPGPAAAPAGVLLLMTGWSFAVGVAAQILWDDRPLTAPLGRLRRVRGASS